MHYTELYRSSSAVQYGHFAVRRFPDPDILGDFVCHFRSCIFRLSIFSRRHVRVLPAASQTRDDAICWPRWAVTVYPRWWRIHMTSSTKPEVHSILHCNQKSTEPCRDNFIKFGVWFWDMRTDGQTDTLSAILPTCGGGKLVIEVIV